jgi:hypothetical protein
MTIDPSIDPNALPLTPAPTRTRARLRRWSVRDFTELIPHPYGEMGLWPVPICGRKDWVPPVSRKKTKPAPPKAGPAAIHAKIDS